MTVTPASPRTRSNAGRAGSRLSVHVHRHISEVDPGAWDSLLDPDDIQLSHRFVSVCQRSDIERADYRFVLIEDTLGVACVAALSCFDVRIDLLAGPQIRATAALVRRALPRFLRVRVLFCGLPVSFGRPCIRVRPDADRRRCLEALEREVERARRELDASIVCWKEFSPSEKAAVDSLPSLGYFEAASLPSCALPIRWSSFEAYVGQMRSGYRRQVREARRLARRAGLVFRTVDDFGSQCEDIHRLYGQVMDRVDFQLERLNEAFFAELNRGLPAETRAILGECSGRLVVCAVLLDGPQVSAFLLAGIDYERNRESAAYVNLVAEVVAHAIRRRASLLELGQTSYDIKRRLGAGTTPRALYLRHRSGLPHALLARTRTLVFPPRAYSERRVFRAPEVG